MCCLLIRELSKVGVRMSSVYLRKSVDTGVSGVAHHLLPCSDNVIAPQNVEFLHQLILSEKIDIVWLNTYMNGQWVCAKKAVRDTPAKLVYTFHKDPVAPLIDLIDSRDYYKTCHALSRSWSSFVSYMRSVVKYPFGYYLRRKHLQRFYRDIAEHCNLVTFLSVDAKQSFSNLAGNELQSALAVVRNPIELSYRGSFLKKQKSVLFVGRLVWQKRVDRLLRAWKELQEKCKDWELVIVGDGPDKALFCKIAEYLQLERTTFEGEQHSLRYYKAAPIVCIPSSHEGLPMVAMEGVSNGCIPFFYDSIHSLLEIFGDEYAAKSWVINSLVQAMLPAMSQINLTQSIHAGRIDALKSLAPDVVANEYIKHFDSLMK